MNKGEEEHFVYEGRCMCFLVTALFFLMVTRGKKHLKKSVQGVKKKFSKPGIYLSITLQHILKDALMNSTYIVGHLLIRD